MKYRKTFQSIQAGDFCNSDTNACEKIPDECQTDADCNEGLTGVCATDADGQTIECKYCDSNGLYNVCKPGTNDNNINYILPTFFKAASTTRTQMRFQDVQLVLIIATSTPTTAKQPVVGVG